MTWEERVRDLAGKVAVVTGAASGIGQALAERFAAEGMRVVLADIEEEALWATVNALSGQGATVLGVRTDVSQGHDLEALAARTLDAFGAVHIACNNAGVVAMNTCWEQTVADWEWVLGVNLWGVIHGIRTFVPIILRQGDEGHVVNTASFLGIATTLPYGAAYTVSKHGVVALSEVLQNDLALIGSRIKVSVLCPGGVNTRIMTADRNRPAALTSDPHPAPRSPEVVELEARIREDMATEGTPPAQIALRVVDAIRAERFYVLPHPEVKEVIRTRLEGILASGL
jgi:NAD(P)-dependent dehydrogenase (short-subunit alcohol dehydrogenase family)